MKIWQIDDQCFQSEIEVGSITLLKGSKNKWYDLVRLMDDFFNSKTSNVMITEDSQPLYPKDWECLFIPFDAKVLLEKITTKSPLKPLLDQSVEQMSTNPILLELFGLWEDLVEDLKWANNDVLTKYNLEISLQTFTIDDLKKFIYFKSKQSRMNPYDYKELFLKLFVDRPLDKKRLILLEFPEFYATTFQIEYFVQKIYEYKEKGIQFIIVTDYEIEGHTNYIYEGVEVNEAKLQIIKRKVINDLPFYCDEVMYNHAIKELLHLVDKYYRDNQLFDLSTVYDFRKQIIIFTIMKHLNLTVNIDTSEFPENLENYIQSYL